MSTSAIDETSDVAIVARVLGCNMESFDLKPFDLKNQLKFPLEIPWGIRAIWDEVVVKPKTQRANQETPDDCCDDTHKNHGARTDH